MGPSLSIYLIGEAAVNHQLQTHDQPFELCQTEKQPTCRRRKTRRPPVDSRDALEILESENKEAEKDAEIERILQAFRLDAYVFPLPPSLAVPANELVATPFLASSPV